MGFCHAGVSFVKLVRPLLLLMGWVMVSACQSQTWLPPSVDRMRFEPAAQEHRILNAPTIKLVSRDDAAQFCASLTGIPIHQRQQPMACAYWSVSRQECTIVTPVHTMTNYIGHELRHCFEGAFHSN